MFLNRPNYRPIDTALNNYHRWAYLQRYNYLYQDLGNNGTAMNAIFPTVGQETIGVSTGYRAFDNYFQSEEPIFYDTKSPYTRMYLVWGGQGRATTRAEYSRNINPRWNFGFNYHPILTNKQVQRRGKSDYQIISHYYDAYTHFKSKDSSYMALATYRRMRHRVNENGGVIPALPATLNEDSVLFEQSYPYYFSPNARPTLTAASNFDQRNQFHLLQQYSVAKSIQLYHMGDIGRQMNWYKDDLAAETEDFYDTRRIDSTAVKITDSTRFKYLQNQVGVKGNLGKSGNLFFNGYYKIKSYNLMYKYLNTDTVRYLRNNDEHYVGGEINYALDSVHFISAATEQLQGGYSRLELAARTKWVDFQFHQRTSKPAFLPTAYSGHFDFWDSTFLAPQTLQVAIFPKLDTRFFFLSPGVTYTSLDNYIYFAQRDTFPGTTQRVLPHQAKSAIQLAVPELRLELRLPGHFRIRSQALYSHVISDVDTVLRVPKLFFNTQVAYENELFKKALQVQIGFDFHWHSAYKALGYDPAIQSFYNQNDIISPAYLIPDFFFNGKMKRGRFFIKWHNISQFFKPLSGYMPTPYYRGQRNIFDFGFDIMMFD